MYFIFPDVPLFYVRFCYNGIKVWDLSTIGIIREISWGPIIYCMCDINGISIEPPIMGKMLFFPWNLHGTMGSMIFFWVPPASGRQVYGGEIAMVWWLCKLTYNYETPPLNPIPVIFNTILIGTPKLIDHNRSSTKPVVFGSIYNTRGKELVAKQLGFNSTKNGDVRGYFGLMGGEFFFFLNMFNT